MLPYSYIARGLSTARRATVAPVHRKKDIISGSDHLLLLDFYTTMRAMAVSWNRHRSITAFVLCLWSILVVLLGFCMAKGAAADPNRRFFSLLWTQPEVDCNTQTLNENVASTPPPPTHTHNTQPRRGHNGCARTTEQVAESVYGGDIQSTVTDH